MSATTKPPVEALPGALEAEQALLGVLLYDNGAMGRIEGLSASHFSEPGHGRLYELISRAIERKEVADLATLVPALAGDPAIVELGGIRYIADLVDRAPPSSNVADYARAVADSGIRRDLVSLGQDISHLGREPGTRSAFECLSLVRAELEKLEAGATPAEHSMISASDAAAQAVQQMRELAASGKRRGRMTGLRCTDRRLGGLRPGALVVVGGRPGMGKCQPLDSKILMRDGTWKLMGDMRLGDALASVDGAPSRVAAIYPQGEKQVYRLTFSDGRSAEASADHLWRVSFRHWDKPRIETTASLIKLLSAKRYQRRVWIDQVSGHFGGGELPVHPWVLGALLGDGCLANSIVLSTADDEMLEKARACLGDRFSVRHNAAYDYRITMSAPHHQKGVRGVVPNELKTALSKLGLMGIGGEDKFIPEIYLAATRADRAQLLCGLLDTDGWAETFNVVRFSSASERLARGVVALVRSLGGSATLRSKRTSYTHKGQKLSGRLAFVVNISGLDPDEVFSLTRKRSRLRKREGEKRLTIHAIEPTRVARTQCIEVTHPSRLYVTDDYVVTHNTSLARAIAHGAAVKNPDCNALFMGIEMGPEEMMQRELSAISWELGDNGQFDPIQYRAMSEGALTHADFATLQTAQQRVPSNLILDDCHTLSVEDVRRKIWNLQRKRPLSVVVIDYLQLMRRPAAQGRNDATVLGEMTASLKQTARQAKTCIVLLSQLSRAVEGRDDKRPQLADLRESGSIEQDADAVLFPFREGYYLERAEPKSGGPDHREWEMRCYELRTQLDVICGKQRQGPVGTDRQFFEAGYDFICDVKEEGSDGR